MGEVWSVPTQQNQLAEMLREYMVQNRIHTQAKLAEEIGVWPHVVGRWLQGMRPSIPHCYRIAESLKIPIRDIMAAAGHTVLEEELDDGNSPAVKVALTMIGQKLNEFPEEVVAYVARTVVSQIDSSLAMLALLQRWMDDGSGGQGARRNDDQPRYGGGGTLALRGPRRRAPEVDNRSELGWEERRRRQHPMVEDNLVTAYHAGQMGSPGSDSRHDPRSFPVHEVGRDNSHEVSALPLTGTDGQYAEGHNAA